MPDAPTTLSPKEAAKLREEIKAWMKDHGITVKALSGAIEYSQTTTNQAINAKYQADDTPVLLAIGQVMQSDDWQNTLLNKPKMLLVQTSTVDDMERMVDWAFRQHKCLLIWGSSGLGKSAYAQARAEAKATCEYIDLDDERYSRAKLLRTIAEHLGLNTSTHHASTLMNRIRKALSAPRVIFIDNAHVLDKKNLWTLHTLRDHTNSTIVAIGQPQLYRTVSESRNDQGIGATIFGRFLKLNLENAIARRTDPTDPSRSYAPSRDLLLTKEDIRKYLQARNLKVHPAGVDFLIDLANCPRSGGLHLINDILDIARDAYDAEYRQKGHLTLPQLHAADNLCRPEEEQIMLRDAMKEVRRKRKIG